MLCILYMSNKMFLVLIWSTPFVHIYGGLDLLMLSLWLTNASCGLRLACSLELSLVWGSPMHYITSQENESVHYHSAIKSNEKKGRKKRNTKRNADLWMECLFKMWSSGNQAFIANVLCYWILIKWTKLLWKKKLIECTQFKCIHWFYVIESSYNKTICFS